MITVSFLPQQGLGNQLWLLFATYSLSKHLNIKFRVYNSHHFKGWKLLSRNFVEKISCINALEQSVEHTFLQPSLFCSQSGNLYFPDTPESYNFLKIFESIVVEDISQSASLLEPSSATASYFSCPDESLSITCNTCILNIRGGDYLGFRKSPAVNPQYFHFAMKKMKMIVPDVNFIIVTDDYHYARTILPQIPILKGDLYSDFNALRTAQYLILSNSSFAFFPAYINPHLKYAFAPTYWAPSTKDERRSSAWCSPANYYPALFSYIDPYDGSDVDPSLTEYEASLSTSSLALPRHSSLASPYSVIKDQTTQNSTILSNIISKPVLYIKKKLLYAFLKICCWL